MVKLSGPCFSLGASGTLGDMITFSTWKGRPYARERVIPSNPKSGAQVGRRAMFTFLTQSWNALSTADKATYNDLADEIVASPFNAFMRVWMQDWHNFITPSQPYPATRIGTPSDNALDSAAWEENRIKLELSGTALGDNWGIIIFAKLGGAVTPAVGNAIIAPPDTTIATHYQYWTPPEVGDWHFDSIAFSDDGAQAAAGGPQNSGTP